jgi:hypothetical protein
MPKEAFGGDDSGGAPQEQKKPKLDLTKYSKGQDANIRDIFWEVISAYAEKRGDDLVLSALSEERVTLTRAAIGAMGHPSPLHAGLTQSAIAKYAVMMILDAGWEDCFSELLEECQRREGLRKALLAAIRKLAGDGGYSQKMVSFLRAMLRQREGNSAALDYMGAAREPRLAQELKKELLIFARGDIGDNQLNAMAALALIPDDEEVAKTMVALLSHWDESARRAAAEFLLRNRTAETAAAAERRLEKETNPDIKSLLQKIAKRQ